METVYLMKKLKKFKKSTLLMTILSVVLTVVAIVLLSSQYITESTYDRLANEVATKNQEQSSENPYNIDFSELLKYNSDVAGWLIVYDKNNEVVISQPVVWTREDDPVDYYLYHDVYRNDNYLGCLFIDPRCNRDSKHLMIYGHNMNNGKMFSDIHGAFNQNEFDRLGRMEYYSVDGKLTVYNPIMSESVEKGYQPIQMFDFHDNEQLRNQMSLISKNVTAFSNNMNEDISNMNSAITLVTCSYNREPGLPHRTFIVFGDK